MTITRSKSYDQNCKFTRYSDESELQLSAEALTALRKETQERDVRAVENDTHAATATDTGTADAANDANTMTTETTTTATASALVEDPTFHIVLYEPQIPPNTGALIRLAANCGCRLHLIGRCFHFGSVIVF
jgi:tRNA G18 (ribose-2'-O)-methylase SpoU